MSGVLGNVDSHFEPTGVRAQCFVDKTVVALQFANLPFCDNNAQFVAFFCVFGVRTNCSSSP